MARIILGHRDGALATLQARTVLAELSAEWPDLQFVLRQVAAKSTEDPLLSELTAGKVNVALAQLDSLPPQLPEGLNLAAVGRRPEARTALVAKGRRSLVDLPPNARVGVRLQRDVVMLGAALPGAAATVIGANVSDALARLVADEFDALLLPAALLAAAEQSSRVDALLDPETFPPAPGQGASGLLVRAEDDVASELAYTFQHRPSFDRARAELAFARQLAEMGVGGNSVGAYATVDAEGDLALFGAVASERGTMIQVTTTGRAKDALEIGSELARDVGEQLGAL